MCNIGYIYKIINLINNKIYIGSTIKNPKHRWMQHKASAKHNSRCRFHRAIRKYGVENFQLEIILTVLNEKDIDYFEEYFINYYKSNNFKYGYNMIGVFKGQRNFIQKIMRREWKNPIQRKKRIDSLIKTGLKRAKSIIAICIYSGEYKIYRSVHEAMREGFSTLGIYYSLQKKQLIGQKKIWFYYENNDPNKYIKDAEYLLKGFKTDYLKPIKSIDKYNKEKIYKNVFEVKKDGFKVKEVRRCLRESNRTVSGYKWSYLD